jgi:hypothetical protein
MIMPAHTNMYWRNVLNSGMCERWHRPACAYADQPFGAVITATLAVTSQSDDLVLANNQASASTVVK